MREAAINECRLFCRRRDDAKSDALLVGWTLKSFRMATLLLGAFERRVRQLIDTVGPFDLIGVFDDRRVRSGLMSRAFDDRQV